MHKTKISNLECVKFWCFSGSYTCSSILLMKYYRSVFDLTRYNQVNLQCCYSQSGLMVFIMYYKPPHSLRYCYFVRLMLFVFQNLVFLPEILGRHAKTSQQPSIASGNFRNIGRNLQILVSMFDFPNLRKYLTPESAGGRI